MSLLEKYGVPPAVGTQQLPVPQYRFIFHMEGFAEATLQVESVEINYVTSLQQFFDGLGSLDINVVMRDSIDTDSFNNLVKYSRNINENKLIIEQIDNSGNVIKKIRAKILSIFHISTKFDYTSNKPVTIIFSLSCDYDDSVE
jgi:hypothetical protein